MKHKKHVFIIVVLFILAIFLGSVIYHNVESWNYIDSTYFVIITMTTIGYGDLVPQTDIGKVFTMFFSFFAIAIAFYTISVISNYIFEKKLSIHLVKLGTHNSKANGKNKK